VVYLPGSAPAKERRNWSPHSSGGERGKRPPGRGGGMKGRGMVLHRRYSYRRISRKALLSVNAILVLFFPLLFAEGPAEAQYYKYKDKDGNWVFTDSPPGNVPNMEIIGGQKGGSPRSTGFRDIEKDLTEKFRPRNNIEKASLSTVTIQSSLGQGSGFFITENGYILTNKHVLRGDETQMKKMEEYIGQVDNKIEVDEANMAEEESRLNRIKSDLDDYKSSIDRMTDPNAKIIAMQSYRRQAAQYEFYGKQLQKRKSEFEEQKSKYRREKSEFTSQTRKAQYDRFFIVILKDKTELEANLVSVSDDHDLALLKMDRCRTPYIQSDAQNQIIQGMRVFAIGSPLGVGDSVSSGVVSGYDRDYIRTDAKIYPGNSGGPLLNADGIAIGINTMKLITNKFEGMGFAIPVSKALQEFDKYLKMNP
jgi:S1-C subfamily serine protease